MSLRPQARTIPLSRSEQAELEKLERKSGWGGRFAPDKKSLERLAVLQKRKAGNHGK